MAKAVDFNSIFTHRHHYRVVLSILLIALLFGLAMLYQYPSSKGGIAVQADGSLKKTESIAVPPTPAQPYKEMCSRFPKAAGEVSCLDAVSMALEKYPGEAESVSEAQIGVRSKNSSSVIRDVWSVKIGLKNPIKLGDAEAKKVAVQIDRREAKILSLKAA